MRYVVIMAGGSGTRLWPLSRQGMPKQLLPLVHNRSLLRLAFERALALVPAERVLVVTGASYLDAVRADLPEVLPENLLGEPVGRDSLNAVAWPAAVLAARDPEAVIAQLTADHLIEPLETFVASLTEAFVIAEEDADALVTLGVVPTTPHTGYGYLQRGAVLPNHPTACEVEAFREKPSADLARQYVDSGDFWWNSGMFVWRAETLLTQLAALEPATHEAVRLLAREPERLADIFPTLRKVSVDYAIMEPVGRGETSGHVVAVALPVDWRDVGGFASLAEALTPDAHGNVTEGPAITLDSAGNLIINRCPDRVVALAGVSGMVVVATEDATLVTPLDGAEQVKQLVALVADQGGPQYV